LPEKSYRRGKFSTVDLLVLTSSGQLLFILKILLTFLTKQATLKWGSTVLSLSLQLVFPGLAIGACIINLFMAVIDSAAQPV
jgi:hypothetical protein